MSLHGRGQPSLAAGPIILPDGTNVSDLLPYAARRLQARRHMAFSTDRSFEFSTANADSPELIQRKREAQAAKERQRLKRVQSMQREKRMKRRGKESNDHGYSPPSSPRSFRFTKDRGEHFSHPNAETHDMIREKVAERRQERNPRDRVRTAKASMESRFLHNEPLRYSKERGHGLRTPNADTERMILRKRMDHIRDQRRIQAKVDLRKAWARVDKEAGGEPAPCSQATPRSPKPPAFSVSTSKIADLSTPNADTNKTLREKLQATKLDEALKRKKVRERRECAKVSRQARVEALSPSDKKILGEDSRGVKSALSCKHLAIKAQKSVQGLVRKRRGSLVTMRDRLESWQIINADTPQTLKMKIRANKRDVEERRRRVAEQRQGVREIKSARGSPKSSGSPNGSPVSARRSPTSFRFRAEATSQTRNADSPRLMRMKLEANRKQDAEKLKKVRERRREAREMRRLRELQLAALAKSGRMSPRTASHFLPSKRKANKKKKGSVSPSKATRSPKTQRKLESRRASPKKERKKAWS